LTGEFINRCVSVAAVAVTVIWWFSSGAAVVGLAPGYLEF